VLRAKCHIYIYIYIYFRIELYINHRFTADTVITSVSDCDAESPLAVDETLLELGGEALLF